MIETDETGQKQLKELVENADSFEREWEKNFIDSLVGRNYASLSAKQKSIVTQLIGKLNG